MSPSVLRCVFLVSALAIASHAGAVTYCIAKDNVFGIDVSKWQGKIDWKKAKADGVVFAYARATNGTGIMDEWFDENWAGMKANGIIRGAYQFFRPGQDAKAQANLMLQKIGTLGAGDLPPMIDVEEDDGQAPSVVAKKVGEWLAIVEAATGKKPFIYTGTWFWDPQVGSAAYKDYPLWESWYCTGCCPKLPSPWTSMLLWQYSSTGSVNGISGNVDTNLFDGPLSELLTYTFGDTPPPVNGPVMEISAKTSAPDVRKEGPSAGIGDTFEGDTISVDIIVKNAGNKNTPDYVKIGYWVEAPYLGIKTYTIYSDWPAKDGKTWKVNDSDTAPDNPPKTAVPSTGPMNLYAMAAGESKRIHFVIDAKKYSLGAADHPDVRAWIWHVGGYYGEQTSWDDPVETNKAGKLLRTYVQHDVFGKTHWEWNGAGPETEGWTIGNALKTLSVNTVDHCIAGDMNGADPFLVSPATIIDASKLKGIEARVRYYVATGAARLYWTTTAEPQFDEAKAIDFESTGDKAFHAVEIDLSKHPKWAGTVTKLRLDPLTTGTGWYDIDYVRAVAGAGPTTGDSDKDGHVNSKDCDDTNAAIHPGATEVCNQKDDDCDGKVDEGVAGCQGGCIKTGPEVCGNGKDDDCNGTADDGCNGCVPTGAEVCGNGKDDDCNGATDEGCTGCSGGAQPETCNGQDDDCDGKVDEDFQVGAACGAGVGACYVPGQIGCGSDGKPYCSAKPGTPGTEVCNGLDDDCDGQADEGFDVGKACSLSVLSCTSKGVTVCQLDGTVDCGAPKPVAGPEVCNGLDDDCDGQTDEGFGIGEACTTGEGACAASGTRACDGEDGTRCHVAVPAGAVEVCNGVDDDCDGEVDEGFEVGEPCEAQEGSCRIKGNLTCAKTGAAGLRCRPRTRVDPSCNPIPGTGPSSVNPEAKTSGDVVSFGGGWSDTSTGAQTSGQSSDGCAQGAHSRPSALLLAALALLVTAGLGRRRSARAPRST